MTANVLRILGMIATPVSQRIGVLMHAAAIIHMARWQAEYPQGMGGCCAGAVKSLVPKGGVHDI
jgi:hypothetical protein